MSEKVLFPDVAHSYSDLRRQALSKLDNEFINEEWATLYLNYVPFIDALFDQEKKAAKERILQSNKALKFLKDYIEPAIKDKIDRQERLSFIYSSLKYREEILKTTNLSEDEFVIALCFIGLCQVVQTWKTATSDQEKKTLATHVRYLACIHDLMVGAKTNASLIDYLIVTDRLGSLDAEILLDNIYLWKDLSEERLKKASVVFLYEGYRLKPEDDSRMVIIS